MSNLLVRCVHKMMIVELCTFLYNVFLDYYRDCSRYEVNVASASISI